MLEIVVLLLKSINFALEVGEVGITLHLHALRGPDERDSEGRGRAELRPHQGNISALNMGN